MSYLIGMCIRNISLKTQTEKETYELQPK